MRPALLVAGFRVLSFRCCRSDKSNAKKVVGDGHGTRARVVLESDHDHRGPAPAKVFPDSRDRCHRRPLRKVERGIVMKLQKGFSLLYALFATRNLTPELSRPA